MGSPWPAALGLDTEPTRLRRDIKKQASENEVHLPAHRNYGMFPQTWEDPDISNSELGGVAVRVWVASCGLPAHAY